MAHELTKIVEVVCVFGMPVAILAIVMRSRAHSERLRHALISAAIEAGRDISPELLCAQPQGKRRMPHLRLIAGIMLAAFGAGIMPIIWVMNSWREGMAGIIFLLPGAALVLADYLIKRQERAAA
jgi:hypothetical protein